MNSLIDVLISPPKTAPIPNRPSRTTISAIGFGSPRSWSQKRAGAPEQADEAGEQEGDEEGARGFQPRDDHHDRGDGQQRAERFYEWEQAHQVEVSVARLPSGLDPGDLADRNPEALHEAVDSPEPFLGFRLQRTLASRPLDSPEQRARLAEEAMAVVNEHPNANVRKLYAGEVAARVGLPVTDLVRLAERGVRRPTVTARSQPIGGPVENAEFAAIVLLVHDWDAIASWLVEALFDDDGASARVLGARSDADGDLDAAARCCTSRTPARCSSVRRSPTSISTRRSKLAR